MSHGGIMSILENTIKGFLYGKDITKPEFVKDLDETNLNLDKLVELSTRIHGDKKDEVEMEILLMKQGIAGEREVQFELKNSFIPMLCLHDIRIEHDGLVAQLDFVIITKKFICVLETKKLNGDIEINSDGDFIRLIKNKYGKVIKKEGMYSPITQNERHISILRKMLIENKIIKSVPIISSVIVASPKTIINKSYAPRKIQYELKKHDQIANFLKQQMEAFNDSFMITEKQMYEISNFLITNNKPADFDWAGKFAISDKDYTVTNIPNKQIKKDAPISNPQITKTDDDIYEALKKYRLETARIEGVKPYFLFNNEEMDDLVSKKPKTISELMNIKGFGPKKAEKYGEAIISIFKSYK